MSEPRNPLDNELSTKVRTNETTSGGDIKYNEPNVSEYYPADWICRAFDQW